MHAFPPPIASEVSLWAFSAAAYSRLVRPERALQPLSFEAPMGQLCDALRRLREEHARPSGGHVAGTAGGVAAGSLREGIMRQIFEALETMNGHAILGKLSWARPRVLEALALAQSLRVGPHLWLQRERAAIDRWVSTARARGLL